MTSWKEITTIPKEMKDGRPILLGHAEGKWFMTGCWRKSDYFLPLRGPVEGWWRWEYNCVMELNPTHWREMEPPSDA